MRAHLRMYQMRLVNMGFQKRLLQQNFTHLNQQNDER